MVKIITPKSIIELVANRDIDNLKEDEIKSRFDNEKIKIIMYSLIIFSIILVFLAFLIKSRELAFVATMMIYVPAIYYAFVQIHILYIYFNKSEKIKDGIVRNISSQFNSDIDLIHDLARDFDIHHLSYAADTFKARAALIKSRSAIFIGAIDKVGIIPLIYVFYKTMENLLQSNTFNLSMILYFVVGVVVAGIYWIVFSSLMSAQWMESVEGIFRQAVSLKQAKEKKPIT